MATPKDSTLLMRCRLVWLIAALLPLSSSAFVARQQPAVGAWRGPEAGDSSRSNNNHMRSPLGLDSKKRGASADDGEVSSLLKDFVLYNGELLDPYQVLKVPKEAERSEIKQAYRKMSRLYHPDIVAFKDILPGACNNLDDVRDHWERITWSYQLLSDTRQRRKYDRHITLADPGKAIQQAVAKAAWDGVASMGKGLGQGLWNMGSLAVTKLAEQAESVPPPTEATVVQYQTKSQMKHAPSFVQPESVAPVTNATAPESV